MSNIIPFESASLPAHLQRAATESLVDDLIVSGGGFPVLSIKGKVFTIKRGDDKETLTRPDDPETAASSIDVVLLRAQKAVTKTYYNSGYSDGADAKPTCYSNDGISPAADAEDPQCANCATCPHNQWGSRITDNGKEAKACQDNKRVAIASPAAIADPMLLRIPPGSFKALTEYAKLVASRNLDYNMVLTKISFVMDAAVPQLKFKPVGFLDEKTYAQVKEQFDSDLVQDIIGLRAGAPLPSDHGPAEAASAADTEPKAEAEAEPAKAAETAEAEKPAPKKAPAKKPAPKVEREVKLTAAAAEEGYELSAFREDGWSDDEIVEGGYGEWVEVAKAAPAKKPAPKKAPAKKPAPKVEEPAAEVPAAEAEPTKSEEPQAGGIDVPAGLAEALADLDNMSFDD